VNDLELFTKITGFDPKTEEDRGLARDDMALWVWMIKGGVPHEDMTDLFKPYASSQEEALDMSKQVWDALGSEGEE